ncbi:hypothetical protein L9F63_010130, partial [Diploptera punctata]
DYYTIFTFLPQCEFALREKLEGETCGRNASYRPFAVECPPQLREKRVEETPVIDHSQSSLREKRVEETPLREKRVEETPVIDHSQSSLREKLEGRNLREKRVEERRQCPPQLREKRVEETPLREKRVEENASYRPFAVECPPQLREKRVERNASYRPFAVEFEGETCLRNASYRPFAVECTTRKQQLLALATEDALRIEGETCGRKETPVIDHSQSSLREKRVEETPVIDHSQSSLREKRVEETPVIDHSQSSLREKRWKWRETPVIDHSQSSLREKRVEETPVIDHSQCPPQLREKRVEETPVIDHSQSSLREKQRFMTLFTLSRFKRMMNEVVDNDSNPGILKSNLQKFYQQKSQTSSHTLRKSHSTANCVIVNKRGFKPSDIHDPLKREFLTNLTHKIWHLILKYSTLMEKRLEETPVLDDGHIARNLLIFIS